MNHKSFLVYAGVLILAFGFSVPAVYAKGNDEDALKAFADSVRAEKREEKSEASKMTIKPKKEKKIKEKKVKVKKEKPVKEKAVQMKKSKAVKPSQAEKTRVRIIKDEVKARYAAVRDLYKQKKYDMAQERIIALKKYLYGQEIDDGYRNNIFSKVNRISIKIDAYQEKQRRIDARERAAEERRREKVDQQRSQMREDRDEMKQSQQKRMTKSEERMKRAEQEDYLARMKREAEEKKKAIERERADAEKQVREGVGHLYDQAVGLYRKKAYEEALVVFQDVNQLSPGYKSVENYIAKLEGVLPKTSAQRKAKPPAPPSRKELIKESLDSYAR